MPPDLMPVLARGKHRNPRRGACFMEFASLLAGERFSDHPRCTHPVLASVARLVNDYTSDEGRSALAPHVPSVIGTADDDPRIGPALVRLCCRRALGYASGRDRFVLSVGLIAADRALAELPDGDLALVPGGADPSDGEVSSAEDFIRDLRVSPRYYQRKGAARAAAHAVASMACDRGPTTDAELRRLLVDCITLTRALSTSVEPEPVAVPGDETWQTALDTVRRPKARA